MCEFSKSVQNDNDQDKPFLFIEKAFYAGTTYGDAWWRSYTGEGLQSRYPARISLDNHGIRIERLNTPDAPVIHIPYEYISGIELRGKWHGGRYLNAPVIKLYHCSNGHAVTTGIAVSKRISDAQQWAAAIRGRWAANRPPSRSKWCVS